MRISQQMPSFQAVAAGQTATVGLPVGMTYHQLLFRFQEDGTEATEAQIINYIDAIRVMVDGDAKMTFSGEELLTMNKFYGQTHEAGVLPLFFARPWQRTSAGEDELAYGTADVQSFNIEVDINAGATAPALTVFAIQGPQTKLGQHICVRRFADSNGTVGINEISDLPKGPYGCLAVHVMSANVKSVEVEANQRKIFDMDTALCGAYYDQTGRVPQAGAFHIDFAATSRLNDNLPLTLQDFRLKADFSAAGSFNILMERIEKRAA